MAASKRILVTGIAGFIGFSLAKSLTVNSTYAVVGLDSINDYYAVELKQARLAQLGFAANGYTTGQMVQSSVHSTLRFLQLNIQNRDALCKLFATEKFDIVVHLAAQAGVRESLSKPHAYIDSNITGFLNVLECCKDNDIQHLIYASSSSVYGLDSKSPFSEQEHVNHPISMYAVTKRSNELMAYAYHHLYKLPVTGLRFFTVYGPWGRPDMSPMLFANAVFTGKSIKVFNEGNLRRDFTYVDDIVDGISKVIELENPSCKIYNIGNSHPVNLMDFIRILEEKIGLPAEKEFLPMQPGDVYETYADVTALANDTGYAPSTSLKKGISIFIDWYKDYYQL